MSVNATNRHQRYNAERPVLGSRVSPEMYRLADQVAAEHGIKVSDFVATAIARAIASSTGEHDPEELLARTA